MADRLVHCVEKGGWYPTYIYIYIYIYIKEIYKNKKEMEKD